MFYGLIFNRCLWRGGVGLTRGLLITSCHQILSTALLWSKPHCTALSCTNLIPLFPHPHVPHQFVPNLSVFCTTLNCAKPIISLALNCRIVKSNALCVTIAIGTILKRARVKPNCVYAFVPHIRVYKSGAERYSAAQWSVGEYGFAGENMDGGHSVKPSG